MIITKKITLQWQYQLKPEVRWCFIIYRNFSKFSSWLTEFITSIIMMADADGNPKPSMCHLPVGAIRISLPDKVQPQHSLITTKYGEDKLDNARKSQSASRLLQSPALRVALFVRRHASQDPKWPICPFVSCVQCNGQWSHPWSTYSQHSESERSTNINPFIRTFRNTLARVFQNFMQLLGCQ